MVRAEESSIVPRVCFFGLLLVSAARRSPSLLSHPDITHPASMPVVRIGAAIIARRTQHRDQHMRLWRMHARAGSQEHGATHIAPHPYPPRGDLPPRDLPHTRTSSLVERDRLAHRPCRLAARSPLYSTTHLQRSWNTISCTPLRSRRPASTSSSAWSRAPTASSWMSSAPDASRSPPSSRTYVPETPRDGGCCCSVFVFVFASVLRRS